MNEVILRAEGPMVCGKTYLLEKIKELLIQSGFKAEMEVFRPVKNAFDECSLKITWESPKIQGFDTNSE